MNDVWITQPSGICFAGVVYFIFTKSRFENVGVGTIASVKIIFSFAANQHIISVFSKYSIISGATDYVIVSSGSINFIIAGITINFISSVCSG